MGDDLAHYDYKLPPECIAQHPPKQRDGAKLLDLRGDQPLLSTVKKLPSLLNAGDLLVVNNSRVLPARMEGRTVNGGRVEVLAERFLDDGNVLAQIKSNRTPKQGARLFLGGGEFIVGKRKGEFFTLLSAAGSARRRFLKHGQTPLPPYICRRADDTDKSRYQTIFAYHYGSVAAPTAGLHFTPTLLAAAAACGIRQVSLTLHVGAGTFKPLRHGLQTSTLHREHYAIGTKTVAAINATKKRGGRVIAVGTTVLRALETAALGGKLKAGANDTDIFIKPGHRFRVADMLFSNFHLPRSSLLVLVCAFGGNARVMDAYRFAVHHRLRFYSYGDAMLLSSDT